MAESARHRFSRAELADLVDRAIDEGGSVIIRRPGRKDLAVVPAEMLRNLDTTAYLLASPKNRRRLLSAIRDARTGKGRTVTVRQLRAESGLG